jgi:hypothetical protein
MDLEHMRHLEKYYQDSTQAMVFLRSEFQYAYAKFMNERHLFIAGRADFQEDTLMALETCKDMERWYEKTHQVVERINYISAVQKGRDGKEHDIQVLRDININQIRKAIEYWVKLSKEPQREIQEKWTKCEKRWENINHEMKGIDLLEFRSLEDFINLYEIVKKHAEQDST